MELGEEIDADDVELNKDYYFVDEAGGSRMPMTGKVLTKRKYGKETTELIVHLYDVPTTPRILRNKDVLMMFSPWQATRRIIYKIPPRRGTVVGELAVAKGIPRGPMGEIMGYLKLFEPRATRPEERARQAKATEEGMAKVREEVVTAESAAVGRGRRRTTRKTRRRQTRRRKRFT